MLVHFYEIRGCTCNNVDDRPVIVAPNGTPAVYLQHYHFTRLADGRWVHYLSNEEYAHIMTGYPDHDVTFAYAPGASVGGVGIPPTPNYTSPGAPVIEDEEEKRAGNRLAAIGFILLGLSFLLPTIMGGVMYGLTSTIDEGGSEPTVSALLMVMEFLCSGAGLASFIIMIVMRVRYPKNTAGKVLMWFFIIGAILLAIATVLLIIACASCLNELKNCPG